MNTITDERRMSHSGDPHTSKEAAAKVRTKKEALYAAILTIINDRGQQTPSEVLDEYHAWRYFEDPSLPEADLYDIRRRMTELDKDQHRIEPIQVGTHRDGSAQYMTRAGQRVMRLVEETNK